MHGRAPAPGHVDRDISEHLAEVDGATVSATTISRVTDVVVDEIVAWQSRPVDPGVYPIRYIAAIGDQDPRRRCWPTRPATS